MFFLLLNCKIKCSLKVVSGCVSFVCIICLFCRVSSPQYAALQFAPNYGQAYARSERLILGPGVSRPPVQNIKICIS